MAQWLTNPTRNHEVSGSIPGLSQWVKRFGVAVSCGVCPRHGSDLALLWLWRRLVATAPIRPLGTSTCQGCGPRKDRKTLLPKKEREMECLDCDDHCTTTGVINSLSNF